MMDCSAAVRVHPHVVADAGWNLYGAKRAQLVATGRKWERSKTVQ
jgi:hypothetical protein